MLACQGIAFADCPPDLGDTGQKGQGVSRLSLLEKQFHCVFDLHRKRFWRVGQMLNGELEESSLRPQGGAVFQISSDGRGIESGGHDHDAKIGTCALQPFKEREREVAVEMTL